MNSVLYHPDRFATEVMILSACVVAVYAALCDIFTRHIPNWTSFSIFAFGIMLRAVDGGVVGALEIAATLMFLGAILWRNGVLGGGDVKLLVAISTIVPVPQILQFLAMVTISGGVLAFVYLVLGRSAPVWAGSKLAFRLEHRFPAAVQYDSLPYGTAIVAGALLSLFLKLR